MLPFTLMWASKARLQTYQKITRILCLYVIRGHIHKENSLLILWMSPSMQQTTDELETAHASKELKYSHTKSNVGI